MINLLSYVGMNLQAELCLWTLLGLLRTIFDATLFKVNANLKQVWQMSMPTELTLPVQRALRTMISGVMLVQCFTVYVYLASYIVLLYPVFLEERPTLVLPWLLLAAVRKFLCELTSLALGLGACLLLGPARPPCIKFVVTKIASLTPGFYMWMLVFSYYNTLEVASAFKTFPAVLQSSDHDYGLELAVRRRRTKSLQDEEQLRKKIVASFNYESGSEQLTTTSPSRFKVAVSSHMVSSTDTDVEDSKTDLNADILRPLSSTSERLLSNLGSYEDWCGNEVMLPRDADRILEQFVLMLLRISAYIKIEGTDPAKLFSSASRGRLHYGNIDCTHLSNDEAETPPSVGNSKGRTASYLEEYPQIFMKKPSDSLQRPTEQRFETVMGVNNQVEGNTNNEDPYKNYKHMDFSASVEIKPLQIESKISDKKIITSDKKTANTKSFEETGNINIDNKLDTNIENLIEGEKTSNKSVSINKMSTSNVKHVQSHNRTKASKEKSWQPSNSLTASKIKSRESVNYFKTSDKGTDQALPKESRLKENQLKISSNTDLKENTASKDLTPTAVDSKQNIVSKIKDSLSKNKKSHLRDENDDETNSLSQSNPSTAPVVQRSKSSKISVDSTSSHNSKTLQHANKEDRKS